LIEAVDWMKRQRHIIDCSDFHLPMVWLTLEPKIILACVAVTVVVLQVPMAWLDLETKRDIMPLSWLLWCTPWRWPHYCRSILFDAALDQGDMMLHAEAHRFHINSLFHIDATNQWTWVYRRLTRVSPK
jgi:hypothetical protein